MTVTLQEAQLDAIIRRVLEKMDVSRPPVSSAYRGVFATADQALEAVYRAQTAYRRVSIAKRKAIIDAIRVEPDVARRRQRVGEALAIVHADLPLIPLYRRTLAWAMRPTVEAVIWPNDTLELRFIRMQ